MQLAAGFYSMEVHNDEQTAYQHHICASRPARSSKEFNEYFSKDINNVDVYVWEEEINKQF